MSNVVRKRTMGGLREVLFDEIDALRNGTIEPARAYATAKLAQQIITSVALELQAARLLSQDHPLLFDAFAQESVCTITVERRSD
jgi:hypothetical protein